MFSNKRAADFFQGPTLDAVQALERRADAALRRALEAGGDLNAVGESGVVPYLYFLSQNDAEAMARLVGLNVDLSYELPRPLGPRFPEDLSWVAGIMDPSMLEAMLNAGLDPNFQPHGDGTTLLFIAAQPWNKPAFDLLLEHGADINAQALTGDTVLHDAIAGHQFDVADYVVDRGADPLLRRRGSGRNAIEFARWIRGKIRDEAPVAAELDALIEKMKAKAQAN